MTDPKDTRIASLEAQLAALQTEMQELTARLSHDLRAPLRHITSYAALVQEEAGPALTPEVQGFLGTIAGSARQMGAMLDGLKELSRVGTVPLQQQSISLAELVLEAQRLVQTQVGGRNIQWHLPANALTVDTDAALLRLALVQVMGNAVKFTAKNEAAQIAVAIDAGLDGLGPSVITITDNGVGYNAAQQGQLFMPFARLHSSIQFPGLGMGLALARKALQRLGGTASLQLNDGSGCRATLTLKA